MIISVIKKFKKMLLLYFFVRIFQVIISAMSVVFFQKIIDGITSQKSFGQLVSVFVGYGVFMISNYLICYLWNYPEKILSNGIIQHLKLSALEKISRIDYLEYQLLGTGSLIKLIENGAESGKKIILDFYFEIIAGIIPNILVALIFIGIYNINIMIYISLGYIVVFIFTNLLLKKLYKIKSKILVDEEWVSKTSVRAIMELVVFRLNKRYGHEINKLAKTSNEIVNSQAKIIMIHELFFTVFAVLVAFLKLVIIFIGIKEIGMGITTLGAIIALTEFMDRVYQPVAIFNVLYVDYKLDRISYNRFLEFFNKKDDNNLLTGKVPNTSKCKIEFQDVSFGYNATSTIKNVSFSIERGKSIALAGESGAGKSTIIKLMLGLLKASEGKIIVNGDDINTLKLQELYGHISYIAQDAPVFDGSLRENIVFDGGASDSEILSVLEKVCLKELVDSLPEGLSSEIGERGMKLSGGERQRLAFARVFFQKSEFVIMDEPTSAMDSITEETVTKSLTTLLKDRAVLIVAHRLHTIKHADTIHVFQGGEIKESGTFQSLLSGEGLFRHMWEKQSQN